jgi:hypothetical protein
MQNYKECSHLEAAWNVKFLRGFKENKLAILNTKKYG